MDPMLNIPAGATKMPNRLKSFTIHLHMQDKNSQSERQTDLRIDLNCLQILAKPIWSSKRFSFIL